MTSDNPQRKGDWIQTYTGKQFWPLDPRPEEVDILDIAHALAHICRYNGHCLAFYSVAQHSCIVANTVLENAKTWTWAKDVPWKLEAIGALALMHDAAEAYVGDVVRPIKRSMPDNWYQLAHDNVEAAIVERFDLRNRFNFSEKVQIDDIIKRADNQVLMTELRDLMQPPPKPWIETAEPLRRKIVPWTPEESERNFLRHWFTRRERSSTSQASVHRE